MQLPEFTPDGGYSLIVRPESVPYTVREKPPIQGKPNRLSRAKLYIYKRVIKMNRTTKQRLAALTGVAVASVGSAMAAVPTAVTTALSDTTADVGTIGGGVLIVALAIFGIHMMRRTAS